MKYLTHIPKSMLYTADWYDYSLDGENRVYMAQPNGTIKFNGGEGVDTGGGGNLKVYTDVPMRDFVRFHNLRSVDGEILYPDYRSQSEQGAEFEVRNSQPILNVWGVAEGYRMILVRL